MEKIVATNKDWYRYWFNSSFYHKLYSGRNEEEASRFVDRLIRALKPAPGSRMLDLGCGTGRHSRQLASRGFRVTGLDLAPASIRQARKYQTANLQFNIQDMRLPFGENRFHYIFNFFTSFGYFENDMENDTIIGNISKALKSNGLLVMDYINSPYSEKNLISFESREIDGIQYRIERWTDARHFYKKITIDYQYSLPAVFVEKVSKFGVGDFEGMFSRHQLKIEEIYGDYNLDEYSVNNSPRLILLARKTS
jgi:SAM-dependent methyltransferase